MASKGIKSVFSDTVYSRCNDVINEGHVAFLYSHSNLMYSFMSQLVTPQYSDEVERAAVTFDYSGRAFLFEVNKEFWSGITFYEQCFVLAHEILHALLDHAKRGVDYYEKVRIESGKHQFVDCELLNIMTDVEINQALISGAYGFIRELISFADTSCFVDTVFTREMIEKERIRYDRKFEYYADIYLKYCEVQDFSHLESLITNLVVSLGGLGNCVDSTDDSVPLDEEPELDYEDVMKAKQQVMDDFFGDSEVSVGAILLNKVEIASEHGSGSFGNFSIKLDDVARSLDEVFEISVKRASQKFKKIERKTCWTAPNKRLQTSMASIDPALSIPHYRDIEVKEDGKQQVLVYMDTSYSCFEHVKKLMELVIGLPEEKYEVETYIFAGHVAGINLKDKPQFFSGGTTIENVYKHAIDRYKENKYDAVFVLTDGEFENCHNNYALPYQDWYWFLVPTYDTGKISTKSTILRVKN